MQYPNATAGPSRLPTKSKIPFVSADHKPEQYDGVFRVVLISTGSVASVKIPEIVGALTKDPNIHVQIVATPASTHFYTQAAVDAAVRSALESSNDNNNDLHSRTNGLQIDTNDIKDPNVGVRVWQDADEWSHWRKVGDPILHIELRRWADLVVVAPCSADILAKIAGGLSENLALSLLRALSPTTPVILCPAMNTHMYQHKFTAQHLTAVQDELGYMVLGPQGAGRLACGDEGPGKMTDWREIVSTIQNFASAAQNLHNSTLHHPPTIPRQEPAAENATTRPPTPPTPGAGVRPRALDPTEPDAIKASVNDWRKLTNGVGGDGTFWDKRWWMG